MEDCSAVDSTVESVESELAHEIRPAPVVESQSSACSVLDKLKAPTKSDLARKRKIEKPKMPTAQTKKHKSCVTNQTDPKSISPIQRIKDLPGECLAVRKGKLFCTACREELALKKSTVKNHINSGDKYRKAKERLAKKEARERDIVQSLQAYDK